MSKMSYSFDYSEYTVRSRSSDPFYIVSYYIKWVTTFLTHITMKIGQNFFDV